MDIRQYIEKGIPIPLGVAGEGGINEYKFGYGDWVSQHGSGTIVFKHQRPGDAGPYSCTLTTEDNIATWKVSSTDTQYAGQGYLQVIFTSDNAVKKTMVGRTLIEPSLGESE